jgi:hypothetical protein
MSFFTVICIPQNRRVTLWESEYQHQLLSISNQIMYTKCIYPQTDFFSYNKVVAFEH